MPPHLLPGKDIMSKLILQDKYARDIVIDTLIGSNHDYQPWPTQWANRKASEVVYMPPEPSPPSTICYCRVNTAPVILIIAVSKINHEVLANCRACKSIPFLFQYRKETWAKSCYIASIDTIHPHLQKVPLHPMVNLMAFFTGRKPSLSDSGYSTDPTMQQLYSIARRVFEEYIDEDTLGACLNSCDEVRKHLRDGLAATQSLTPSESKDHIERCIGSSLLVVEAFYAKYASHDSSSSRSQSPPSPTAPSSPSSPTAPTSPSSPTAPTSPPSRPSPPSPPSPTAPTAPTSEGAAEPASYSPANQWEFVHSHIQKHKAKQQQGWKEAIPWSRIHSQGQAIGRFYGISIESVRTSYYRWKALQSK